LIAARSSVNDAGAAALSAACAAAQPTALIKTPPITFIKVRMVTLPGLLSLRSPQDHKLKAPAPVTP
jgi:hypothetical protein